MLRNATFNAVIHQEGNVWIADCPETGTVSQGESVEEALANLKEATELYLEETAAYPIPQSEHAPVVRQFTLTVREPDGDE